jgi:uncharacterized membrane protein YfcA
MDIGYTIAGLLVGFVVGLTGVGGGSLMTPLLMIVFHVPAAFAVGTDLLYASITKAGGSVVHGRKGNVNWRVVLMMGAGSIPAAVITVFTLKAFALEGKSTLITTTLGIALILTAAAILFKNKLRDYAKSRNSLRAEWSERRTAVVTVITGVVLGVLVTISSVGAGALGTVALFFLYPRFSTVQIVGTDIAHAVPLTAGAGIGHAAIGTVDWTLLGSLLLGSLPGIYIGSHIASHIPERVLRPALAGMLVLIGGKLIF